MPFVRFVGVNPNLVEGMSPKIIDIISTNANTEEHKVKIEWLVVEQIANPGVYVEIGMFSRQIQKNDVIAHEINLLLKNCGLSNVHIYFIKLQRRLYYVDGNPITGIEL